jgi:hypothetical protein
VLCFFFLLQNLAASPHPTDDVKSAIVEAGAIPLMVDLLRQRVGFQDAAFVKCTVAVLLNLAIGSNPRKELIQACGGIPAIAPLIGCEDNALRSAAMRALSSLSIGAESRKVEIAQYTEMHTLITALSIENNCDVWHNALILIQALVSGGAGSSLQKQRAIDCGFTTYATLLLASGQLTVGSFELRCVGRPPSETCETVLTTLLLALSEFQGNTSKDGGGGWIQPTKTLSQVGNVISSWTGW